MKVRFNIKPLRLGHLLPVVVGAAIGIPMVLDLIHTHLSGFTRVLALLAFYPGIVAGGIAFFSLLVQSFVDFDQGSDHD